MNWMDRLLYRLRHATLIDVFVILLAAFLLNLVFTGAFDVEPGELWDY